MAANKKATTKRNTKTTKSKKPKQKYNPKMARKIARTKDVDAKTRRVNNAAVRTSRTKAKDSIYTEERKLYNTMKEKNRLLNELAKAMMAYDKRSGRLPPKKRITDLTSRLKVVELPLSRKDARKAKEVEEVLKIMNMTAREVLALYQVTNNHKSDEMEMNNRELSGVENTSLSTLKTVTQPDMESSGLCIPTSVADLQQEAESCEIDQLTEKSELGFRPFYNADPEDYFDCAKYSSSCSVLNI